MTVLDKVKNFIFPLPVMLATCRLKKGDDSTDNIIPLSWIGIVEHKPHMINVVIGRGKYSSEIIKERKEFGLCAATVNMMEKVDMCGYCHGDKVDKFKMTGWTKFPAEKIDVSLIKECPICLEYKLKDVLKISSHDILIAEVVCTHVEDRYLDADGEPDFEKMDILCNINDIYWTAGKKLKSLYYSKNSG